MRWDAELSITALRFSNVLTPDDYPGLAAFESDRVLLAAVRLSEVARSWIFTPRED